MAAHLRIEGIFGALRIWGLAPKRIECILSDPKQNASVDEHSRIETVVRWYSTLWEIVDDGLFRLWDPDVHKLMEMRYREGKSDAMLSNITGYTGKTCGQMIVDGAHALEKIVDMKDLVLLTRWRVEFCRAMQNIGFTDLIRGFERPVDMDLVSRMKAVGKVARVADWHEAQEALKSSAFWADRWPPKPRFAVVPVTHGASMIERGR